MNEKRHSTKDESKCLLCDDEASPGRRGLCTKHYMQFVRRRKLLTEEAAIAWENRLIQTRKLLPNRQGQRTDASPDAFADEFEKFVEQHPTAKKPTAAELAAKLGVKTGSEIESPAMSRDEAFEMSKQDIKAALTEKKTAAKPSQSVKSKSKKKSG